MEPNTPLDNLDTDRTLAVLATTSGYAVFPKVETTGVINGYSRLGDEAVDRIADQGIPLVDARYLDNDQLSQLSYLNTLTPMADARHGPAGEKGTAHLSTWMSVCGACGARLYNSQSAPLHPGMFSRDYGLRLVAEGMLEGTEMPWQFPKDGKFERTKGLAGAISKLPVPDDASASDKLKGMMGNILLGEVFIANTQGLSEAEGIAKARGKLKDWSQTLADQVEKLPALAKAYPVELVRHSARLIARDLDQGHKVTGPSGP